MLQNSSHNTEEMGISSKKPHMNSTPTDSNTNLVCCDRCNDPSLSRTIPEDGETVSTELLFKAVLIPPIFLVSKIKRKRNTTNTQTIYFLKPCIFVVSHVRAPD